MWTRTPCQQLLLPPRERRSRELALLQHLRGLRQAQPDNLLPFQNAGSSVTLVLPKRRWGILALIFLFACGPNPSEALLQQASQEWLQGRHHSAVQQFKSVLEKTPTGPHAEEALFRLGQIYHFSLEDSKQAASYFLAVLKLNKQGRFAFDAQKHLADIVEYNVKDYDQAIIENQKLIDGFDLGPEEKARLQYRIASIYFKKQNYEQALVELEILLEEYPKTESAQEAGFKIAEVLYTINRCPEVHDRYDRFVSSHPMSPLLAEMEFVRASCLEEEGKHQEALKAFQALDGGRYKHPAMVEMKIKGITQRIKKVK